MYGVIFLWRVLPGRMAEHETTMKAILRVERERCPEVLLNLMFGPAADGTCAEIQVYADEAASQAFAERVSREDEELSQLWSQLGDLCLPESARTIAFEGMSFLGESFLRNAPGIAGGEPRGRRLEGKVALVTGGAQGNGFGIAKEMAREGACVAIADLSIERINQAIEKLKYLDVPLLALEADISDEESVRRMIASMVREFGGLDLLVNNAGIFPFKPIEEFTVREFTRVLEVNLIGPWLCSKYAFPEMKRRGGGAIVNITSASGHYGGASVGGSAYDSSKGGLRQMTCSLAAEFGPHNVRVNAIAPGVVVTEGSGGDALLHSEYGRKEIERTPMRRLGFPEDVGRLAVFLASSDADYINGVTVILDGGAMAVW